MKLNLACGTQKLDGYINIDITPETQPDRVMDLLEFPWKGIADDSIAEIHVSHFCEHIPHEIRGHPGKDGLTLFMEECYRVMLHSGKLIIKFPYAFSTGAVSDPTHTRYLTPMTFQYYDNIWRRKCLGAFYPIKCDFPTVELEQRQVEGMELAFPMKMLIDSIHECSITMVCQKPVRHE